MSYIDILPPEIIVKFLNNRSLYDFVTLFPHVKDDIIKEYVHLYNKDLYRDLISVIKDLNITWYDATCYVFTDNMYMSDLFTDLDGVVDTKIGRFKFSSILCTLEVTKWISHITEETNTYLAAVMMYKNFNSTYEFIVSNYLHIKYGVNIFYFIYVNLVSSDTSMDSDIMKNLLLSL